ncbi:MAG: acyl-CoA dehydrogenase family protein [Dehalococcoidia bacterium]|nr:acyl-CoA dehydrogenase family protein [Dehalococcoidia bacterium]
MDWGDTPEQGQFRQQVREFIHSNLPDYYRRKAAEKRPHGLEGDWQEDLVHGSDEAKAAAKEWAAALNDRGWAAPHWPTQYGGGGMSPMEQFIYNAEMAEANAPIVGGQGLSLLGPTLLVHGTEEQRQRFLAPTLRGEILWAQGFSEPGAGSDLASLQTRATRDGDEYIVNGQKMWTSTAHKSNWLFGMFRTDPEAPKHRGISFLVMDMTTPGLSVRPIISMGWEHATNETFYEDVRVPRANLVGEENRGWYVGVTLLDFERSNIAGAVQTRRELDDLIANVTSGPGKEQVQHGGVQRERHAIAEHYIESEVMFNYSFRIISMQARGIVPNYEASTSKMYHSELVQRVSRTAIKAYGLYSNVWDPDEKWAAQKGLFTQSNVHSVVGTIAGGSSEIQRNIIATRGLGLPRG